jgi:hypothetical protein
MHTITHPRPARIALALALVALGLLLAAQPPLTALTV